MKRALALLAVVGCDAIPAGDGPRRIAVREIGEQVIEPGYDDFATRADALDDAVAALAAAPDPTTLDRAQAAWRDAREPWMEAEAYRFGPVVDRLLDAKIDQSPIDPDAIEAIVAGTAPIDDALVDVQGANKKGFHAIEHLLFDPTEGDAGILAGFSTQPRRLELAAALARDLHEHAVELDAAWDPDGEAYLERFVDVGGDGATFETIKIAIDGVVNQCVFLAEKIADTKLGKPLGLDLGTPQPELEESGPSDNSLEDIDSNLRGLAAVWQRLRPLIAERSPVTAARVDGELEAAHAAIAAVPRPFAQALADEAPETLAAWEAVRELRLSFAVDVVALLGATLSFNDNDGD